LPARTCVVSATFRAPSASPPCHRRGLLFARRADDAKEVAMRSKVVRAELPALVSMLLVALTLILL
jgi:hypothetical protein